jgi:HPt (histidine-containing phosphotransfer) domain-containing protein
VVEGNPNSWGGTLANDGDNGGGKSTVEDLLANDPEFRRIYNDFRVELANWLDEIVELTRNVDWTSAEERIEPLRALAHRIAGTASSFGFADIGETAESLEIVCAGLIDGGEEGMRSEVERLVGRLHAAAESLKGPKPA